MKVIAAGAATAAWMVLVLKAASGSFGTHHHLLQPRGNPAGGAVSAVAPRPWMWRNSRFVYEFSPAIARDPARVAAFENACHTLVAGSALRCVRRSASGGSTDTDYVYVVAAAGNHSLVGRQGGRQVLGIRAWNNPYKIAHEIKHALGWAHEQQHPRRDEYIEVLFENIAPRWRAHFRIRDLGNEGPYDFDSVMHYYPADFARPGARSLRALPGFRKAAKQMGQRSHLSATDLQEIRAVYGSAPTAGGGAPARR